jgi:hypothetical protein
LEKAACGACLLAESRLWRFQQRAEAGFVWRRAKGVTFAACSVLQRKSDRL